MRLPIRSIHWARSTTLSSEDSVLSVRIASSMALPKNCGKAGLHSRMGERVFVITTIRRVVWVDRWKEINGLRAKICAYTLFMSPCPHVRGHLRLRVIDSWVKYFMSFSRRGTIE